MPGRRRKPARTPSSYGWPEPRKCVWSNGHRMLLTGRTSTPAWSKMDSFERWATGMIDSAKPLSTDDPPVDRDGVPDSYTASTPLVPESRPWPTLRPEALYGLPGRIVWAIEPHTEADR